MDGQSPPIEQPYSVSQLTHEISRSLEETFDWLQVRGEISNYKKAPSGHVYFRLKDDKAVLECVAWRSTAARWGGLELGDGTDVIAGGSLTVYPPRGQYQLVVNSIRKTGAGVLQQRFEELKQRLYQEGLFDEERKKPLPAFPQSIAVITSPTGAAIHDFITVLQNAFCPIEVTIYPTLVQGEKASSEITEAIHQVNQAGIYDLLVLCRGGGSLEDLWAFNEEIVARAIAGSSVPVMTGVGHEVDFTIADFAADIRASTPTNAAQRIAELFDRHRGRLRLLQNQFSHAIGASFERIRERFETARKTFERYHPLGAIAQFRQRLDGYALYLIQAIQRAVREKRPLLEKTADEVVRSASNAFTEKRKEIERYTLLLKSLEPVHVLQRGFSICQQADGNVVRKIEQVQTGDQVDVFIIDGSFQSKVNKVNRSS